MSAYLGDPREGCLSHERPYVLETDGNDHEHYQWGAMIIDLCGMDPDDYKTTIFNVQSVDGGGGSIKKTTNNIKATIDMPEEGSTTPAMGTITLDKAPTSEVVVAIKVTELEGGKDSEDADITADDIETIYLTIPQGQRTVNFEVSKVAKFSKLAANIFVGATQDTANTTKYTTEDNVTFQTSPITVETFKTYYGVYPFLGENADIAVDALLNAVGLDKPISDETIGFTIDCYDATEEDQFEGEDGSWDEEGFTEFLKEKAFDFILAIPKGKTFKITDVIGGNDVSSYPKVHSDAQFDYYRKHNVDSEGLPTAKSNNFEGSTLTYEVKLTINK